MEDQAVYLDKIKEALTRLSVCEQYLVDAEASGKVFGFESAAVQMRKAMEAIAFASIAPNREQYSVVRSNAEKSSDYRKDWNARSICLILKTVNPDFYPQPIGQREKVGPNAWHYGEPQGGHMSQATFEKFYARLGRFLHADNPWDNDKGWSSLGKELADAIKSLRKLLTLHRTSIRTKNFRGVWVVEAPPNLSPAIYAAYAAEEFTTGKTSPNT
jgi:hypothetical protein